jgi:hypothetical protein
LWILEECLQKSIRDCGGILESETPIALGIILHKSSDTSFVKNSFHLISHFEECLYNNNVVLLATVSSLTHCLFGNFVETILILTFSILLEVLL